MTNNVTLQKSLLHSFKRKYVASKTIRQYLQQNPGVQRRVGSLPIDWLREIPKDEYAGVTAQVDDLFSKFAKDNLHIELIDSEPRASKLNKDLEKQLTKILKRPAKVEFVGWGAYKNCRKITVGDYSYALSSFFEDNENCLSETFGPTIEPQLHFYAYKNYSHGRIAKPFMAKYGSNTNFDGTYVLMQYIDKNDTTRAKVNLNNLRINIGKLIHYDDNNNNSINGVFVDIGGMERNPERVDDKKIKNNLFVFFDRIYNEFMRSSADDPNSVFEKWYNQKAEAFLTNKLRAGVDIYSVDLRELLAPLNPKEQKAAIKIVRRMRPMHNLKVQLQKADKYDKYLINYIDKTGSMQSDLIRVELRS